MKRLARTLPLVAMLSPLIAQASSTTDIISELAGLFYIIVGLTLTFSILYMIGGIIRWISQLGTELTYRDKAIRMMEWAVATLFTLVLVLGVVEFVQRHTSVVLYIISIAIILLFIWLVATSGAFSGGGKKEEEE